ncbi:MAG: hypothetical protein ACLSVD_06655 [Eggerthellaceae bacterium]
MFYDDASAAYRAGGAGQRGGRWRDGDGSTVTINGDAPTWCRARSTTGSWR